VRWKKGILSSVTPQAIFFLVDEIDEESFGNIEE